MTSSPSIINKQPFCLRNITVWSSSGELRELDLIVEGGILQSIAPQGTSSHQNTVDGTGLCVLPLGVDPQVHLRTPGQWEKETPDTAFKAALSGAIGAVLTMPNTKPVIDRPEVARRAKAELQEDSAKWGVAFYLSGSITMELKGKIPADYKGLVQEGVRAFTDDGLGVVSDEIMEGVFRASADYQVPVLQHAEFPGHGGIISPGAVQKNLGVTPYQASPEVDMVKRDLALLKKFPGARYHILHVSSAGTLDLVREAKAQNLPVTCEVSPHHLAFSEEDIDPKNTSFKMNPPLRSRADQLALKQGLKEGVIDFVATDHAPHDAASKGSSFKTAAFGTIGLETFLRYLLTMWQKGELSTKRLVEVFSTGPARFLGLDDSFGDLKVGQAFRAALIDPQASSAPFAVHEIYSLSKNSCFLGYPLPRAIKRVWSGSITWNNAEGHP